MNKLKRHSKPVFRRPMKHKKQPNYAMLKKLGVAILITIVATFCYVKIQPHTLEAKQQIQLEHKSQQLKSTLHELETQKVNDTTQQKKLDDLQKQLKDTQDQLQAKKASAMVYAAALPVPGATNCGSDPYLSQIYQHESGCCPTKWQGEHVCPDTYYASGDVNNANVGYGLCQSTPAIKMATTGADWATSWATQDAWCRTYAISRYGSTEAAWNHWQSFHNW